MRVLVLNNYSFDRVIAEIERGLKPAHHLYGVDFLKTASYDVVIIPFNEEKRRTKGIFYKMATRFEFLFGDMQQQRACLKILKKGDVIYAACQTQTSFLSYLRFLRIINNNIITLAHHFPVKGRLAFIKKVFFKAEVNGCFAFPALSTKVSAYINTLSGNQKSKVLHWGPDRIYYDKYILQDNPNELGFFCAGRTGRDYKTMIKGAELADKTLSVYYLMEEDSLSSASADIKIKRLEKELDFPYNDALKIMARSRAICIPLFEENNNLVGLTSLTDAIGMGKPVIMTRNSFIDIDIEKEGIGVWTEPGDTQSWEKAFDVLSDDNVYRQMSENSLRLRNDYFNYGTFCSELKTILDKSK